MSRISSRKIRSDEIDLDLIKGIDPDLQAFLDECDRIAELPFDPQKWNLGILEAAYLMSPMVLIERDSGFYVLGCGTAFTLAKAIERLRPDKRPFSVWIVEGKKLSLKQKFAYLSAESIGLAALHRTRQNGARALAEMWRDIETKTELNVFDKKIRLFKDATGFSSPATDWHR